MEMMGHVLKQDLPRHFWIVSRVLARGGQVQFWIDEGKVWYRSKGREPRLLSYDETPFSYVSQISFYILCAVGGLWLVWLALGGSAKKRS